MSESDVLVLLSRALNGLKGTQCTQFINTHSMSKLTMRTNCTGSVYRQIDKDRPSDLSNNTHNILFGLIRTVDSAIFA